MSKHLLTRYRLHTIPYTYVYLYAPIVPQLSLTSMHHKSKYILTRYRLHTIPYTYVYLYAPIVPQLSLTSMHHKSKYILTRYRLHTIAYTYTYLYTLVLVYSSIAQSYIHVPQEQVHLNTLQTRYYNIHLYIPIYSTSIAQS